MRTITSPHPVRPAADLSRRDAQARAALLASPAEALALLRRALAGGDEDLAVAVARRGAGEGWGDVVDAYAAAAARELPDHQGGSW